MIAAILLSGGTGTRMGTARPKQYLEVGGRSILSYSMQVLIQHQQISALQIVADPQWHDFILHQVHAINGTSKLWGFSSPGKNRQESIFHALQNCESRLNQNDAVLIHDAARPLLSSALIDRCVGALDGHDGVLPVLNLKDTVYLSKDGTAISGLLNREEIFAGQAPELFLYGKYYRANQFLTTDELLAIHGSTEPAILAGMDIAMVPGEESNFKITTNPDLLRFEMLLQHRKGTE